MGIFAWHNFLRCVMFMKFSKQTAYNLVTVASLSVFFFI